MIPSAWPAAVARAGAAGEVRSWLAAEGIDVVHLGLFDTSGTLREKRLPAKAAAAAFERGWSFIDAVQYWDAADGVFADRGAAHEPASVDLSSGRRYPFETAAAAFVADFSGPSAALSPRRQLERMVERAAALGVTVQVGWEFECIVLEPGAASLSAGGMMDVVAAMASNRCWSALTPAVEADVLRGLSDVLSEGGIALHHLCAELGPGCLELALDHGPPLRAADDAAMMKLFTKAFFARLGHTATFMAQIAEGFPGLGGHPSISLWDDDGRALLAGGEQHGLSKLGGSAVAGVVKLLPELVVMAAPNVNSYRRLAPGNWAPRTASWGPGNYSCALRTVTDRAEEARLELRIPGADTSPHLCLAMLIGAVVWGIERALAPPDAVVPPVDARLLNASSARLPRTLLEAADSLAASEAARELFGSTFVEHFAASRVAEDATCRRFVPPQERLRYLHQV